jgi:hypothetical protein
MSVVTPRRAIGIISTAANPKQAIIKEVGDLTDLHIFRDDVLIGTYIRPEKTSGGIIRPDSNVEEDVWQGKVGLILKFGHDAFEDTPDFKFTEIPLLYDWAVYFIGDAKALTINGYPCRLVRDVNIRMTVEDPQMVF